MTLKVKLFNKDTELEAEDIMIFNQLSEKIDKLISEEFSQFSGQVKIYGEIIPMRR